jgi:hypothetical protein
MMAVLGVLQQFFLIIEGPQTKIGLAKRFQNIFRGSKGFPAKKKVEKNL